MGGAAPFVTSCSSDYGPSCILRFLSGYMQVNRAYGGCRLCSPCDKILDWKHLEYQHAIDLTEDQYLYVANKYTTRNKSNLSNIILNSNKLINDKSMMDSDQS